MDWMFIVFLLKSCVKVLILDVMALEGRWGREVGTFVKVFMFLETSESSLTVSAMLGHSEKTEAGSGDPHQTADVPNSAGTLISGPLASRTYLWTIFLLSISYLVYGVCYSSLHRLR